MARKPTDRFTLVQLLDEAESRCVKMLAVEYSRDIALTRIKIGEALFYARRDADPKNPTKLHNGELTK